MKGLQVRDEGQNDATELGRSGAGIRHSSFLKPARQTRDAREAPSDQGCAAVSKTDLPALAEAARAIQPSITGHGGCESASQSILARRGNHYEERPDRGQRDH